MKHTTLCPCGSGKLQAHCCGEKSTIKIRLILTWSVIILIGGTITVIAFTLPSDDAPLTTVGTTPTPYQYDPITNKHWDPAHGHFHDGLPPAANGAASGQIQFSNSGNSTVSPTNPIVLGSTSGSSAVSGNKVPAPPNIIAPTPWQYDIATDRHYDPNHVHWHSGRPPNDPANAVSVSGSQVPAPPNITNPQPWQYESTTDRHFDPNHGHWHSGSPPGGN